MAEQDTICAIATSAGRAGVGIVRVSGPLVALIAESVLGQLPQPRQAQFSTFRNRQGLTIDKGIALYFPAPASFTGEDVLELQGHGGDYVLNTVRQAVLDLGARHANPGEFSERAFLNNKIDLVQAEAIADLIDASSRQAARSAMRTLVGEFSRRVETLVAAIIKVRVHVEAAIDFPDEEVEIFNDGAVRESLLSVTADLEKVRETARQGVILKKGLNVVIAGAPNAGKSSLLNKLCEADTAIVTDIPGTTRDILTEQIDIDGLPIHVMDTAGLRVSPDPIEEEGIRRAANAILKADRILLVVDSSCEGTLTGQIEQLLEQTVNKPEETVDLLKRLTVVMNKVDLVGDPPLEKGFDYQGICPEVLGLSAKTGEGIADLRNHLKHCAGYSETGEDVFVARERHLSALESACALVQQAITALDEGQPAELVAEELRLCQLELDRITGKFTSDDLLGEIFSSFCIGK